MRVGITGHQERPGIDWGWVRETIGRELLRMPSPIVGLSSLARGADQVFAQAVLDAGGTLIFVRPTIDYERHFEGSDFQSFRRLRDARDGEIAMPSAATDQDAFLAAGQRVASESDILMAVWDGKEAVGKGGTADVVRFAQDRDTPIIRLDPVMRTVSHLD